MLSDIHNPTDLKKLAPEQLPALAEEIRSLMIPVVTQNGGHLASSLGAVELIIALHYIFNAPEDRIVFDVGHQAYAHKILTGRADTFNTIRLEGGLSGFLRCDESPYDTFITGHSSTSISAALGLAVGRDLLAQNHCVVAVLGDGALTGGMAMEALNNAGALQTNLLVVYNDNRMSISPNVGALSQYLSLKMTTPEHLLLREKVKGMLEKIMPLKGNRLIRRFQRAEEAIKGFLISPTSFLAAWGFKYLGPIDGHDLKRLVEAFKQVKNFKRPVLLHVMTTKGKGFAPAESDPQTFHGVGRNKIAAIGSTESLEPATAAAPQKTYTDVFGEFIVRAAERNPKIAVITPAMSQGTGLDCFFKRYPDRAFDVGIAEQHAVTLAAGLAASGLKPVAAIYSTFLQRAFDQLFHDVALQNLPVILAVDRAGLVGEDGPTHHGGLDLSFLRLLPNFTVMAPKDEHELSDMLAFALTLDGPVAIRYPRGPITGQERLSSQPIEKGRAELLRAGSDLTIAAIGQTVWPAMQAAKKLEAQGLSIGVLNMRFVKPLDTGLLTEVAQKTDHILTAEENTLAGGLFGAVAETIVKLNRPISVKGLGLGDTPVQHATQRSQRALTGLDAKGIELAAASFFPNRGLKSPSLQGPLF
ncbi:MAG: 1-deoxy-D-xylulose-5-phosphate synthase [Deltaproteobacteria bacterium]|nr:1-deoxy-D-xylulose-5-phosphate synthase [Deltaproteobacteria bacterium]